MLTRPSLFTAMLVAVTGVFAPGLARGAETSLSLQFADITTSIVDPFVLLYSSAPGTETFEGFGELQTIPTGASTQSLVLLPSTSSQTNPAGIQGSTPIDGFVIVGVYPPTGTQGVAVGVSPTFAGAIEGETYTQLTAPLSPLIPSEADTVAALENPTPTVISAVLAEVGAPIAANAAVALIAPNDGSGDLVDFSDGTLNGSFSSTLVTAVTPAVPLPSAAWMALMTLCALAAISSLRKKIRANA